MKVIFFSFFLFFLINCASLRADIRNLSFSSGATLEISACDFKDFTQSLRDRTADLSLNSIFHLKYKKNIAISLSYQLKTSAEEIEKTISKTFLPVHAAPVREEMIKKPDEQDNMKMSISFDINF